MIQLLVPALLAAATPVVSLPLTPAQTEQVRCVAALAIVASEQQRGNRADIQPLAKRGAHFAGTVGEALTKDGARSRDQVKADILAEVAAFQKGAPKGEDLPRATVTKCIALMEKVDPPLPPPTFPQCAAMLALAYDDVHAREGLSKSAKDLATFGAVLDARAREVLRDDGKGQSESDAIIGTTREKLIADAKAGKEAPDIELCFEMARP